MEQYNRKVDDDTEEGDDARRAPPPIARVPFRIAPQVERPAEDVIYRREPARRVSLPLEMLQPRLRPESSLDEDDDDEEESEDDHTASRLPLTTEQLERINASRTANGQEADIDAADVFDPNVVPLSYDPATPGLLRPDLAMHANMAPSVPAETPEPFTPAWPPAQQYRPPTQGPAERAPDDTEYPLPPSPPLSARPGFGGAAVPPIPAIQRWNLAANQPPESPIVPPAEQLVQSAYGKDRDVHPYSYNQAPQPVTPAAEQTSTLEARDRRLVPAVVLAVGFEYFARRRADRRLESRVTKTAQERERGAIQSNEQFAEQQQVFAAEQRRQTRTMEEFRLSQERLVATTRQTSGPEQRPLPPIVGAPELRHATPQEQAPIVITQPEAQQLAAEQEPVREQADAWRRFSVDKHGNEIVTARPHGEQYYWERQQEIIRDRTNDTSSGAVGLNGSVASPYDPAQYQQSLPSGMTTPSLPAGQSADPQHRLPAQKNKSQITSNVTNPWFWLMLALIVAAFFTAASL